MKSNYKLIHISRRVRTILIVGSVIFLSIFWLVFYQQIFSGQRHIGWDLDGYNYPLDSFLFEELKTTHHMPQIDPFSFNAVDFIGNIQVATFYPLKAGLLVFDLATNKPLSFVQYQYFDLLLVLLFSVLVFLVSIKYFKSILASLLSAMILTYNGFMQAQLEHVWFFMNALCIPIIILGLIEGVLKGKKPYAILYVFGMVAMIFAGYPLEFLTVFTILSLVIYAYAYINKKQYPIKKVVLRYLILTVASLLISSVQLLPSIHDILTSVATVYQPNLPFLSTITLLLPNHFGHLTGPLTEYWERTTTYFYIGGPLIVGCISWLIVLLFKKLRKNINLSVVGVLLAVLIISFIFTFSPLPNYIYGHILHIFGVFRPWMVCILFMSSLSLIVVYPFSIIAKQNRMFAVFSLIALIFCILNLRTNMPAFFNTATGSAKDISLQLYPPASSQVTKNLSSMDYSTLVNQTNIGGYWDDWPRLWEIRSIGGHDPVLQKNYISILAQANIDDVGERLSITQASNINWLKDNGVGYYVDTVVSENKYFSNRNDLQLIYTQPDYSIWKINGARKIFSANSSCISKISYYYTNNVFHIDYSAQHQGCSIRSTVNYSSYWNTDIGNITPAHKQLGFNINNLPKGRNTIVVNYNNSLFITGIYVSFVSIVGSAVVIWRVKYPFER